MVQWVPCTGGEKESLQASLNRHRDAVGWKLQGLDDAELHRAMLPSGNTLAWLGQTRGHLGVHLDLRRCGFCPRSTASSFWNSPTGPALTEAC